MAAFTESLEARLQKFATLSSAVAETEQAHKAAVEALETTVRDCEPILPQNGFYLTLPDVSYGLVQAYCTIGYEEPLTHGGDPMHSDYGAESGWKSLRGLPTLPETYAVSKQDEAGNVKFRGHRLVFLLDSAGVINPYLHAPLEWTISEGNLGQSVNGLRVEVPDLSKLREERPLVSHQ